MRLGQKKTESYVKPAAKRVTIRDLDWASGFLEGEGCFSWTSNGGVYIVAAQAIDGLDCLHRLQQIFGGTLRPKTVTSAKEHHKSMYQWSCTGSRARGVAMTLYSLMGVRRQMKISEILTSTNHREALHAEQSA